METDTYEGMAVDRSKKIMDAVLSGQSFYEACRQALSVQEGSQPECNKGFKTLMDLIGYKPVIGQRKIPLETGLQTFSKLRSAYKRMEEESESLRDRWWALLSDCRNPGVKVGPDELRYIRNMGCSLYQQCYLLYNLFLARGISKRTARMLVEEICKIDGRN